MHAEIIAIGDEITSGQLLDTNTRWLSSRLEEMGVRVLYHTAVGDLEDAIADVFRRALERADVVVATGGLGPTADDLTREGIARATDRKLVPDPEAMKHVRGIFALRGSPMPKRNERQAMFPQDSRMIPNPNGTAPGIAMDVSRPGVGPCRLFAIPGVPAEMKEMWNGTVAADVRAAVGQKRVVRHRRINCFGAGESRIEAMLPDLIRRGREPRVGITAAGATIILRITAEGATERECLGAMEPTVATIRECLEELVFGEGDDCLQHAVARLLEQNNKTLATVESDTGGLVAEWMSEVEEAAGCYLGGVVAGNHTALTRVLDVPAEPIERDTARSVDLVRRAAEACRVKFNADYGLAVGPFPQFAPDAAHPEPLRIALATAEGTEFQSYPFAGHPALLKILSAKRALNVVRLAIR